CMTAPTNATASIRDLLRFRPGTSLADIDTNGHPGFDGDKDAGKAALPEMAEELSELQEKMYAAGYTEGSHRVLLVLQGMDTSGKGGVLEHTVGLF
ncbi:polyphosphate kinase 2 family protein, partial [Microbacterium sp. KNMS]